MAPDTLPPKGNLLAVLSNGFELGARAGIKVFIPVGGNTFATTILSIIMKVKRVPARIIHAKTLDEGFAILNEERQKFDRLN